MTKNTIKKTTKVLISILIISLFLIPSYAKETGTAPPPTQMTYTFITKLEDGTIIPNTKVEIPALNIQSTSNQDGEGAIITYPSTIVHKYIATKDNNYYNEGKISFSQDNKPWIIIRLKLVDNPDTKSTNQTEQKVEAIAPDPIQKNETPEKGTIENLTDEQINKLKEAIGIPVEDESKIKFVNIECTSEENKEHECCVDNYGSNLAKEIFLEAQQKNILLGGDVTCDDRRDGNRNRIEICFTEVTQWFSGEKTIIQGKYCDSEKYRIKADEKQLVRATLECEDVICSDPKYFGSYCCDQIMINNKSEGIPFIIKLIILLIILIIIFKRTIKND